MAVVTGVITAWLSRADIPKEISDAMNGWAFLGLGLLASGGSGLWNSVLSYLLMVKDIMGAQAKALEGTVKAGDKTPLAQMPPPSGTGLVEAS